MSTNDPGNSWVAQISSGMDWAWIGVRNTEHEARAACLKHHARLSGSATVSRLAWVEAEHGVWIASVGERAYRVFQR